MIPTHPDEMDRSWIEEKLGAPSGSLASVASAPVGTGQMCDSFRLTLDWESHDGPATIVAKCPSTDQASRNIAKLVHNYELEISWYRDLAAGNNVNCPHCYHAEIAENGVDFAHFQFIHGTADLPEAELSWGEWDRNAIVRAKMGTPRGSVNGVITSKSIGPGQSWVRFEGICETLLIACLTPVDEDHVHVRYFFSQPKDSKTGRVAQAIIADVVKQMDQDKVIWDRQYYAYKPIICQGDGPIAKFRMFYSKYYAGNDGKPRHVLAAKDKAKA